LLAALAALEVGFLAWFLLVPLPNAPDGAGRGRLNRGTLLLFALPGVVPGVTVDESLLGLAARELSHVEHLPERLPIALAALWIAASLVALGHLILRATRLRSALSPSERAATAFGLGAVALGVATLSLGRLGLLSPWPIRLGLGLPILVEMALRLRDDAATTPAPGPRHLAPLLVVAPFLLIMALGALLPTTDFDSVEYHLQGPKEYYRAGRIAFLPHNVYTSMPFGVEMLHLLGMVVLGDWWRGALAGQLLVALHAPAAAAMAWLLARRLASPRAAWVAVIVYLSTPWVYRIATIPYVEGPLCYYHAAIAWAIARAWDEAEPSRRARLWGVIGLMAGGAMACKYPALVSAVVPAGAAALVASWRRRSWPLAAAFGLGVAASIGPWLVKNVIDTRNPVYPLAYDLFDGRHWGPDLDLKWSHAHGRKSITLDELTGAVVDVAGRSDWQSPLFAMLAPLALLRRGSRRGALILWGYVLYLFATWWLLTHRLDRFWLPLLPAAAVLAGLGADWSRGRAWSILLRGMLVIAVAANLVFDSSSLAGLNQWTTGYDVLRDRVPAALSPALTLVDLSLPPDAKVLSVAQAGVFHMRHPIVYNTVFNRETIETIARGRDPEEVRRALHERGITHVFVDWAEVRRYRSPGNYGFTDFVTPDVFDRLRRAGALEPVSFATPDAIARLKAAGYPVDPRRLPQELYRVR
jgi:hypothetical protein